MKEEVAPSAETAPEQKEAPAAVEPTAPAEPPKDEPVAAPGHSEVSPVTGLTLKLTPPNRRQKRQMLLILVFELL